MFMNLLQPEPQKETLQRQGYMLSLERTGRKKTINLQVKAGEVRMLVPANTSTRQAVKLLDEREAWVQQQLLLQRERICLRPQSLQGARISLFGRPCRVRLRQGSKGEVVLDGDEFRVYMPASVKHYERYALKQLKAWCIENLARYLEEAHGRYLRQTGLAASRIEVRTYRRRWGSCDSRGVLRFNWLLAMAPAEVIDYVLVHEICHLRHMDHSRDYWSLVEKVMPDFRRHKRWLREWQPKLPGI